MKHKHAEFIKAWANDNQSVQCSLMPVREWFPVKHSASFDDPNIQFRLTPKPEYWYLAVASIVTHASSVGVGTSQAFRARYECSNIRLTYINGKLTAAEVIKKGDGK